MHPNKSTSILKSDNGLKIVDLRDNRNKPKVSVIIPVYNSEKYLSACLDSLVNQTLDEIELIFISDPSTDNSLEILLEYQKKYPDKLVVISLESRRGIGGARNVGMKYAHADWIGFTDSDDIVGNSMFERMYENTNSDADMIVVKSTNFYETISDATNQETNKWSENILALNGKELTTDDKRILIFAGIGGFWTQLIRKEVIAKNNLYFPENIRWEDNELAPVLRAYISKIIFIPEILYYYRQNPLSVSRHVSPESIDERIQSENTMILDFKRRDLFKEYYREIEYIGLTRYLCTTSLLILADKKSQKYSRVKSIQKIIKKEYPTWKKNAYFKNEATKFQKIIVHAIMHVLLPFSISARIYLYLKYNIYRKIVK